MKFCGSYFIIYRGLFSFEVDELSLLVGGLLEGNFASIFTGAMPALAMPNFFAAPCDTSISRPLT